MFSALALSALLAAAPAKDSIDAAVKKEKQASCAAKEKPAEYCALLDAFLKGAPPTLPEGRFFSVGALYMAKGKKGVFIFFVTDKKGSAVQAAAEALKPESDEEAKSAEEYRQSIAKGSRDITNELHPFLSHKAPAQPLHEAKIADKALQWEISTSGPGTTWVRQSGNKLIGVALRVRGDQPSWLVFDAPIDAPKKK